MRGLTQLIDEMVASGATDLHLKVPGRPQVRMDGTLVPMPHERLLPADTLALAQAVLELAGEPDPWGHRTDARVAFSVEGVGRFRAQVARQRGSCEVVIHRIALEAPAVSDFQGLDAAIGTLTGDPGLVLVGGGRPRRGALAAMIRQFNENQWGRLVSVEDPIDWLHRDARASISQREVGTDVASFRDGVLGALRQDPDAVVVSDVPEPGDVDAVLRAAEEGVRVFAGIPVGAGDDAVLSFVGRFPESRGREIACRVAGVLRGVVTVDRKGHCTFMAVEAEERAALRAGQLRLVG